MSSSQPDPPGEERLRLPRRPVLEQPRPLQEELPLLGEEQTEAAQVDLHVVGLDLRKVGVDRQVERQVGGDAVLDVDARVGGELGREAVAETRSGRDSWAPVMA